MSEQYKISLGVDVDVSDIQSQINTKAKDVSIPIKLEVENIGDIKKQIQGLGVLKDGIEIPLSIDTSATIKSAQQVGQKIGTAITKNVKQSINIDDIIDKEVLSLMKTFSIAGDKGSDAFKEIRQALIECRNELQKLKNSDIGIDAEVFDTSRAFDKVSDAIANQMRAVNSLGDEYIKLAKYMANFNNPKKGNKVRVPDFIKQEQGDDYKSSRGTLGIAFNTERGISFASFIEDLNHELGTAIDLTKGEEKAYEELVHKLRLGREQLEAQNKSQNSLQASASTDDILAQNFINKNEIRDIAESSIDYINATEAASSALVQASVQATNTVVQNEERKQQAYRESSGVIENLKTTLESMRVDKSSIDTIIKDVEELGFTAKNTSVEMKNGKFDITVNGIDDVGRAITEIRRFDSATDEISLIGRKISQPLAETDKFIKQQKKSVADLTNQINQLNRSAIDQNANRPIKDSTHLDALEGKYNEITAAIQRMGSASSGAFDEEANNVRTLISEYKSLTKEFRNAENVSSKMKGTDFDSGLDIAKNDLEKFKAQAKDFPQITATIEKLDEAIEGVGDVSSLNKFNDQLRVARSELAKIKSETIAANRSEKVGINVSGLESKIADLQRISPEIDRFETEIDGAKVSVQSLLNDLKKVNTQSDFSVVNSKWMAFTEAAKAAGIAVTDTATKAKAALANDIKLDIELGNIDNQMDAMRTNFNSLSDANDKLRNSFEATEKAYKAMVDASKANTGDEVADRERLIQAEKEYAAALEKTNNLIKQQARADKISNDALRLQDDREIFQAKIDSWLTKNSAATERFGAKLKELRAAAETADRVELNHLEKELIKVDKAADKAGLKMMSLGDRIKSKAKEYMAYLSVAEVFMWIEQAARAMFDTVLEIDTAMTGLYRVTDLTSAQYDALFNNMIDSAKEYGATLNDIINATSDWVRAGFDADTALGLAEVTTMYQHISDLDYDTAAENLITAYNGFKNELDTAFSGDQVAAVNYIADIFNELDNNFAVTSAGLGEALTRSASALDLAGNTIQETAGMVTGIVEVTKDPEQAGSTLKILSLRLRGMKGALEELGEETDENVENLSKMQGQILNLTKGKVNIFNSAGEFRSTYDIMRDIANIWDNLNSTAQADLLETIAGKHRANSVAALLSNWQKVEAAVKSANEAEGSAARENAKYVDSLQGRLDKLTTAWQSFANTFMKSDFLKGGVSALTDFVERLEKTVKTFGSFGTVGLGVGIFGFIKNFGTLKTLGKDVFTALTTNAMDSYDAFKKWSKASDGVVSGGKKLASSMSAVAGGIGLTVAAIGIAIGIYKKHREEISKTRQEVIQASDEFLNAAGSFEQAYIKYSGKTNLTAEEEAELESAINGTVDALGDKSSKLQQVVNSSNDYVASLERITDAELKAAEKAAQEKQKNAKLELEDATKDWYSDNTARFQIKNDSTALKIAKEMDTDFLQKETKGKKGHHVSTYWFDMPSNADADKILDYYYTLVEYKNKLLDVDDFDTNKDIQSAYEDVNASIEKLSETVKVYEDALYDLAKAEYQARNGIPKTTEAYLEMREAILAREDIARTGLDTRLSILNSLDSEYANIFDLSSAEAQARKFVGIIKGFGDGTKDGTNEIGTVETFLNMRTAVNNNDCSVGEYLSELDNVTSMSEKFSDEEQKQFKLAFNLDTDSIKGQYDELKTKLTDEYYGIEMSDNNAKTFLDNLKSRELFAARDLFSSDNADFKNILKDYNSVLDEAEQASVDFSKTTYGNINTNARQTLEWTNDNLKKYKDELMSWEPENASWDNVKENLEGNISTVMGTLSSYEIDGKEIDIAFSPMLQTDNGAEILSSGTVDTYINELIAKATEDGKWDKAELIALDAKGIEVDGQKIKGILADVGETAKETAEQMHFVGENGALAMAEDELFAIIEKQAKFLEAMNYTIAIDVETESLDALNSALSESVSGAGLTSDSIAALKGRYAELASQGYDLSKMFEETSNGIHLNKEAVSEFEHALASQKLSETDGKLDILKNRYDELTKEINNCTDAGERAHLYSEQQEVVQKINDLATLASQYKGLTSAYNAWQNAESAGNERDMYENIISGFETIEDEISRGWYDDGTIKFLELMTGQTDLAGKSASELKEIWNSLDDTIKGTSYSVKDFFTTDEDGNSTSTGAYNFLRAVEELGKNGGLKALEGKNINELVERNSEGKIVAFDFDVVGGDEAVAKALGVSEEMVQIIQRTLDDAGFVVTLDGKYTLLADLKISAEEANDSLKKLQSEGLKNLKDLDLNFDFNVDTVEGYQEQLEKALNVLDKFRNKDGTLQTDKSGNLVEGAKNALEIAEYYTAAMDKLTEPKFMQIDTSTVDEELQEPIEKMQEIGDLCKEKHLVSLTGDTKELDKVQGEIDKVAKEIEQLEPEVKAKIGIDEDWDAKTIADKIEKGEIEVPAELKLDVQMSEDLKDMRLLMMRQLGLVSEEEVKLKVGYEIDESTVDDLTPDEQKVVVKFITENEDWFDKLTDDEKKVAIELVTSGIDLDSLTDDEKKEVVVEFVTKNEDEFDKLSDEEKQVVVDVVTDDKALKALEEHGVEIEAFCNIFGVEKVDDLKKKLEQLDDEQILVLAEVLGRTDVEKLKTTIAGLDDKTVEAIAKALGEGDVEGLKTTINGLDNKTVQAIAEAFGYSSVDSLKAAIDRLKDKDVDAVANVDGKDDVNGLKGAIDALKGKTVTVWAEIKQKASNLWDKLTGGGGVDGTAHVSGTAFANGTVLKKSGKAYKQGDWGTKSSGVALGAELGPELLVRNGRWHLIGEDGAQFFGYKRGDIIFNADQTREIFEKGKITHGNRRGKALVSGTAFSSGSGGGEEPTVTSITVGTNKNTGKSYTKSADDSAKDFEETFDWIEIAIDRVERAIDQLDKKANSVYRSWSERNSNLTSEISRVSNEISLQERAYQEYLNAANAVGLSSSWATKVRNGTIDIETVKDEALAQKIKDYEDLYNKALDAKDAVLELKETEAELIAQRFENVQTQYDGILQGYEHTESMLNEYISQAEEQGFIVSKKYYEALVTNEKQNINALKQEQAELIKARDEAVASGKIAKGSEAWLEQCASIDEVTQAIEEGESSLLSYARAMEEIDWSVFDLIQERISGVTEEADFLIELLSNKKLFDDNGKLTSQGSAILALHAQNYNAQMYAADELGAEVAKLDAQIKNDPFDQELINRRNELLAQQREMILSAEESKESIKSLIEDGYDAELEALDERIQKYEEALDSQKDLFDYEKKVTKQSQNLANLRKELSSYENDTSEESKKRIQELRVSISEAEDELAETQYDKYISDQSALLDSLYEEYELAFNTRIDNIDALLESAIENANANATSIQETLTSETNKVGITLSNAMNSIWNSGDGNAKSVLTMYGEDFKSKSATIITTLNSIKSSVNSMVSSSNKEAATKTTANKTTTSAKKSPTTSSSSAKKTTTTKKSSSGDGVPKIGDRVKYVSGQYYYDSQGSKPLGSQNKGEYVYITNINARDWATHGYHISTGNKLGKGDLGWLKLNQLSGYASGKKDFLNDEVAWTQEGGLEEYIVRPSDGAILTPIAKKDSVLNAQASNNLWNMTNSPAEFIKENLKLDTSSVPNNSNVNNSIVQNFENITFSMPNVHGYNELLREMQSDPKFEKLILSMTIDQIAGRSKLAKGKSIR